MTITKFKEEMRVMNPGCWCNGHDLEGRAIYDMHEVDPEQNEVGQDTIPVELISDGAANLYGEL